jgi:hypothetical protein
VKLGNSFYNNKNLYVQKYVYRVIQKERPIFLEEIISETVKTKVQYEHVSTRYGLDGPGIENPLEERFFAPVQTGPGSYPASYTMGTGSLPGVKRPGSGAGRPTPI